MPATETNTARCAGCGGPVPRDAPFGQCPRCVLGLGRGLMPVQEPDGELLDAGQLRRVGDYELLEEIARGGMGVVYRARQLSLGREVAVKMILAGELATPESVQRFRNEAAAAAKLEHPHIVPVYEIGEHGTQHFFSMRLVPGGRSLAAWASGLKEAPAERARLIAVSMAKVARAVAFAHGRGVLHRDLKPSNVLVDEAGEPQVVDFGIARPLDMDSDFTLTGQFTGTPRYMAPEQARGEKRITAAADIYSLGVMLYELLAGRKIFDGGDMLTLLRQVTEQPPSPLRLGDRDLENIVLHCLQKVPSARYGTAAALADDLERWLRGEPVQARPVGPALRLAKWMRRHPAAAALAALGVAGLAVGAHFWVAQGSVEKRKDPAASASAVLPVETPAADAKRLAIEWFHRMHGPRGHLKLEGGEGELLKVEARGTLPAGKFEIVELWLDHWQASPEINESLPAIDPADFRRHAGTLRHLKLCFLRSLPLGAQEMAFLSRNAALGDLTIENCPGAGGGPLMAQIAGLPQLFSLNLSRSEGTSGPVTAAQLSSLACLPRLVSVYLMFGSVDDAGAILLAERCRNIVRLGLAKTSITDVALSRFNRRPLAELRLDSNLGITDAGLAELAKIPALDRLYLRGCENLTSAGVEAFRKTHPECQVDW